MNQTITKQNYETTDLKLAAFLAATGHWPRAIRKPDETKATLVFPDTPAVRDGIAGYERGAQIAAKLLLEVYGNIYHLAAKTMRFRG